MLCLAWNTWLDESKYRSFISSLSPWTPYSNPALWHHKYASHCDVIFNKCSCTHQLTQSWYSLVYIDGLVQERCNSSANALELRLPEYWSPTAQYLLCSMSKVRCLLWPHNSQSDLFYFCFCHCRALCNIVLIISHCVMIGLYIKEI